MKKNIITLFIIVVFCQINSFAQQEITVEKIWKSHLFYPQHVQGFKSLNQGDYYTVINPSGIDKYSFETGEKVATLLSNETLLLMSGKKISISDIDDYAFDITEKKLLIAIKKEHVFRRSTKAIYHLINLRTGTMEALDREDDDKQSFATFSNDGKHVAYVKNNNLFVKDLANNYITQITSDGEENFIKNGIADWVYEEELGLSKAFEWSPDGSKIAFLRFDESNVEEFSMTMYGDLYPDEFKYKYPKAGEELSLVDVFVYDLKTQKKMKIEMGPVKNYYTPRIYWLSNSIDLIAVKSNRHQNHFALIKYNTLNRQQAVIYSEENSTWISILDTYYFLEDNQSMIITSEQNGFNHIYKVTFGGEAKPLTAGNWEVAEICAIDYQKRLIYYLSNESAPLNRDLYVIDFEGQKKKLLSNGKGWNRISFNANANYFLKNYSDNQTPPVYSICKSNGKELRILQDNKELRNAVKEYGFVPKEMFSFTTDEGILLNGWMIKPPKFNPAKQYPVLMYVYGGPGSQEVNNSWFRGQDLAWYQMLAQKGYIVACVDGRGTSGRGVAFKNIIYKQMGNLETIDQIAAAKYLKTLPFVDVNRVGIWGWSFGGYLSTLAICKGEGIFKMAIAVAPVTNWRYYDNIYTERFLQTPQENPSGYDDNSPIFHADKLKGAYLLVHGMADDNVHFQNSVDMVTALIENEKQFEQFFYPNMNHFINHGTARYHLYTKLTDFVLKNL